MDSNQMTRSKSTSSISSRYRDDKIMKELTAEELDRRTNIANELAKIDLSGKNINDYTHLTSIDNLKIIYWVGTLRDEDDKVNLKLLKTDNPTHEKLYKFDTKS